MTMKNRYCKRTHISERKYREILKYFCDDFTISQASKIVGVSRQSVSKTYQQLRRRIYELTMQENKIKGDIEIDESYFGAKRIRGKRGRGAGGKIPVVGLLKRNGKVYTAIIKDCSRKELLPIIQGKVCKEATIYTDGWKSYDSLVLNGYKHYRIHHHRDEFARGKNHVNGIESFWSYTKRRLRKFNGIRKEKFMLHLKESEYRWNYREKMYKELLNNLRSNPL